MNDDLEEIPQEERNDDLFTFDEGSHTYQLNGKKLTGTTTILGVLAKPALIPWAAKMATEFIKANGDISPMGDITITAEILEQARTAHTKKKDDAATHGTDAHAMVEEYINNCLAYFGGSVISNPHLTQYDPIRKFVDWAEENVQEFLFAERKMYDIEHWFAGTADFAYVGKDGLRYMADFKTSSGIYGIDYFLQVAAYRYLAEILGEKYDAMMIVRLGKDGKFETQSTREYSLFRDTFFACLAIYRAQAKCKMFIEKGERTRAKEGKVGIKRKSKSTE